MYSKLNVDDHDSSHRNEKTVESHEKKKNDMINSLNEEIKNKEDQKDDSDSKFNWQEERSNKSISGFYTDFKGGIFLISFIFHFLKYTFS